MSATALVAEILATGAYENARRVRFLKFGYLAEFLCNDAPGAPAYAALFDALARRPASEVVDRGTPFFWKNVHRCYQSAARGEPWSQTADWMLRCGFDAFYEWLPNGCEMRFAPDPEANLVLPRLGVRIEAQGREVIARRISDSELQVDVGTDSYWVPLDNLPAELATRKLTIPNGDGATLACLCDPSLFEDDYIHRLDPNTDKASHLAQLIGQSLQLIEAAMPELARRFCPFVQWYMPINAPDALTHNSLSVKYLSGAMFLSVAYQDFRLAEAMVHELHHNELYMLQESELLYEYRDDDAFYSPFRTDARPLEGLLHALFVFSGVAEFIARLETLEAMAVYHRSLYERRCEVVARVRLGLAQLPFERLTDVGRAIAEQIDATIVAQERVIGELRGELPLAMQRHLAQWRAAHPDLTRAVKMPPGIVAEPM